MRNFVVQRQGSIFAPRAAVGLDDVCVHGPSADGSGAPGADGGRYALRAVFAAESGEKLRDYGRGILPESTMREVSDLLDPADAYVLAERLARRLVPLGEAEIEVGLMLPPDKRLQASEFALLYREMINQTVLDLCWKGVDGLVREEQYTGSRLDLAAHIMFLEDRGAGQITVYLGDDVPVYSDGEFSPGYRFRAPQWAVSSTASGSQIGVFRATSAREAELLARSASGDHAGALEVVLLPAKHMIGKQHGLEGAQSCPRFWRDAGRAGKVGGEWVSPATADRFTAAQMDLDAVLPADAQGWFEIGTDAFDRLRFGERSQPSETTEVWSDFGPA